MEPEGSGHTGGVAMDPRPTLDVTELESPKTLLRKRKRLIREAIKATLSKKDRRKCREVLSRYRRKQRRLSGSSESDPDPYDETYVFYCLGAA